MVVIIVYTGTSCKLIINKLQQIIRQFIKLSNTLCQKLDNTVPMADKGQIWYIKNVKSSIGIEANFGIKLT